jgi:sialate O-acetylesterase
MMSTWHAAIRSAARRWATLMLLAAAVLPAHATVRPHALFSDGAVLQQGMPVPVWGTASAGETVRVSIQGQTATTTALGGEWRVRLRPLKAGGPYTLTIAGENTLTIQDVLVGEVWVCSGQSNMEWPLSRSFQPQEAIARSQDAGLRLWTVPHAVSDIPRRDTQGAWKTCGPETLPGFSAVAYYFGRDLRRALGVPVGLIQSTWGGTPAEAWTSRATLASDSALRPILERYREARRAYPEALRAHEEALARHRETAAAAEREGRQPPRPPAAPGNPESATRPSGVYNAMIAPLQPYAIRGVIWYQGESNAGRADEYRTLFPAMIRNWREAWGQGADFPFLFVQLAPFMKIEPEPTESGWAELREAQRLTALRVPNTAMAVITDAGDEADIHPARKEPVGARLALAARAVAYGERVAHTGPIFRSMEVRGNRAILRFKGADRGLVARGGELTGFTLCGEDRKWVNARAILDGDRVIVESPSVSRPAAVRFGWANYPVVNLYDGSGLPASPFRTDDFPWSTAR